MNKLHELRGTGVALVTPFNANGTIDFSGLEKLVDFVINNDIEFLVLLGTTGESATLSKNEKKQVVDTITKVNQNRLPMVLGIGGNNTASVCEEIKSIDLLPFRALLSVSPYYNKPSQEGIMQHYTKISEVCPIDVIIYNVPGRTSSNVLPDTIFRLASERSNIIGVKEAGNNIMQMFRLIENAPDDFLILSGDDDLALSEVLAGADGVISVLGQGTPKLFSDMIRHGLKRESKKAFQTFMKLLNLTTLIFKEGNPAGIKSVLEQRGICTSNVRLPLVKATASLEKEIAVKLDKLGLAT